MTKLLRLGIEVVLHSARSQESQGAKVEPVESEVLYLLRRNDVGDCSVLSFDVCDIAPDLNLLGKLPNGKSEINALGLTGRERDAGAHQPLEACYLCGDGVIADRNSRRRILSCGVRGDLAYKPSLGV